MIEVEYYQHDLSNGQSVEFFANPLDQSSSFHFPKDVDQQLYNVLLSAENYPQLSVSTSTIDKIFLGFSSENPSGNHRVPLWLPTEYLTSHILIGGAIGSGKTSLTYRLLAGALNVFGTVVIGEAKGGVKGTDEGAAFTNIAKYLSTKLNVNTYRFPRGNCWFNPLLYLKSKQERKTFLQTLSEQIPTGGGELASYVQRAVDIASLILEYLIINHVTEADKKQITLRNLVMLLKNPAQLEKVIDSSVEVCKNNQLSERQKDNQKIKEDLNRLNFLSLKTEKGRDTFIMTANGLNLLINVLDQEDLLYYTEYHQKDRSGKNLNELKLDDPITGILYKKSLVVVSQPLNDPSSKIVGVMFWDALLNAVLDLAPNPINNRQNIVAILDETHRLPVGKLGNSGDFLRQYNLALVEITPSVVDKERWERNKHVYQTVISLSPAVNEVASLMYDRLPNYQTPFFNLSIGLDTNADSSLKISPKVQVNDLEQQMGQENPGVSLRGMLSTGKFTALLQSRKISQGFFWLDLESPLLSKFDELLADALSGNQVAAKVVDYALGLVKSYQ